MRYAKWKSILTGFRNAGMGAVLLAALSLGLIPVQAQAVEVCNSDIHIFGVEGPTPFFEGDELILKATIGAGLIKDDDRTGLDGSPKPYIDFTGIGYGIDCGGGPMAKLSDCKPVGFGEYPADETGHDIEFLGVTGSDCPTSQPGVKAIFPLPESDNIVSIPVLNGVVRQSYDPILEEGETCNVDVQFKVKTLHKDSQWVEQALGVPFDARTPGDPDDDMIGTCSNDLGASGYGKTVFKVERCDIDVIKQVKFGDGEWQDANDEASAPRFGPGETAYYRLIVTNNSSVDFIGNLHVVDNDLGVNGHVAPAFVDGEMIIGGGEFDVEDFCATKLAEGEGYFMNTASVTGTCRGNVESDDYVFAVDDDVAYVNCFKYPPRTSALAVRKFTNGDDANSAPGPYIPVGGDVTWTYQVINTGNEGLTIDSAIDDMEGVVTCDDTFLAKDESTFCTAKMGVATEGQYQNDFTVVATSDYSSREHTETDPSHYFGMAPAIDLVKTPNPMVYGAVGQPILYTFKVTNTGNVLLTNVHVSDPLIQNQVVDNADLKLITCPQTELAANGGTMDCTGTYLITQADMDAGTVPNTATVHGTDPNGGEVTDQDSAEITTTPVYSLALVKTALPLTYSAAGQPIAYSYELTNTGNQALYKPYTVDDDKATVTCPGEPAMLAPGDSVTCSAVYSIKADDITAGLVTNVADATAKDAPEGGNNVTSNTDTETVYYIGISVRKEVLGSDGWVDANTVGEAPIKHYPAGALYRVVVKNIGKVALKNVYITDADVGIDGLAVNGGSLAVGQEVTVTEDEAGALNRTTVCEASAEIKNTVYAGGDAVTSELPVVQVNDVAWVKCVGLPEIEIKKYISVDDGVTWEDGTAGPVESPSGALYKITVQNTGQTDLVDIRVTDSLIDEPDPPGYYHIATLAKGVDGGEGEMVTITSGEWPELDMAEVCGTPGTIQNSADVIATSAENPDEDATDDDSAYLDCIGPPMISVLKEVSIDGGETWHDANDPPPAYPTAIVDSTPETALYRITVENIGDVKLVNVKINDKQLGIVDYVPMGTTGAGILLASEKVTIDSGDIAALSVADICSSTGTKTNVAIASGKSEAGAEDSMSDSATVDCIGEPMIQIVKEVSTDDGANWSIAKSTLAPSDAWWRITLKNIGNVDLVDVKLDDAHLGITDYMPIGKSGIAGELEMDETVVIDDGVLSELYEPTACAVAATITNSAHVDGKAADSTKTVTGDASATLTCTEPVIICGAPANTGTKPSKLVMEYNGTLESDNSQGVVGVPPGPGALPQEVRVKSYDKPQPLHVRVEKLNEVVSIGDDFDIGGWGGDGRIPANILIEFWDVADTTVLQSVIFHGSCSAPLIEGESFGGATIIWHVD